MICENTREGTVRPGDSSIGRHQRLKHCRRTANSRRRYAFAGYYFQNTVYTERAWLVRTDSAGKVQWNKIYGPDVEYSDRYFYSFQQTMRRWVHRRRLDGRVQRRLQFDMAVKD
jgi:hypothetical protein